VKLCVYIYTHTHTHTHTHTSYMNKIICLVMVLKVEFMSDEFYT
jgi:hypothetical protein